jgi:hypothetical protein
MYQWRTGWRDGPQFGERCTPDDLQRDNKYIGQYSTCDTSGELIIGEKQLMEKAAQHKLALRSECAGN